MEEFQSEEEEPWYDQQDLEQGKDGGTPQAARDGGSGDARARKRANLGDGRVRYLLSGLLFGWQSQRLILQRQISALLLQTTILAKESLKPMDRGREPRAVLSTRAVNNLLCYISKKAGSPKNLLQAESNRGSYDTAFISEQSKVELPGTLVEINTWEIMYC